MSGLQGMLNSRFWGKKALKPKGKSAKKIAVEKARGQADELPEKD